MSLVLGPLLFLCPRENERHPMAMLAEIYIQGLLVDEELADQVWEAWDKGEIDDQVAWLRWWLIGRLGAQRAFS